MKRYVFPAILVFVLATLSYTYIVTRNSSINFTPVTRRINDISENIDEISETIAPKPTKILSTGLPNKHYIKAVFVPQAPEKNWDQPWQDTCEEAALLTPYYLYSGLNPDVSQIKQDILKMVDFEHGQGWDKDIDLSQMYQIITQYLKFNAKIIENPSVEDLKRYISQDIPVIVPSDGRVLYRENKHFKSGGPPYHNLVILGYDDDKNVFIVHDVGTQFGANFKYSYDLLLDSIHDLPPSRNKYEIQDGNRAVLLMLK